MIFPFECSVLNKGTTGTIFITPLVWHLTIWKSGDLYASSFAKSLKDSGEYVL